MEFTIYIIHEIYNEKEESSNERHTKNQEEEQTDDEMIKVSHNCCSTHSIKSARVSDQNNNNYKSTRDLLKSRQHFKNDPTE